MGRLSVVVQLVRIREGNALQIAFSLLTSLLMILKDMLLFTKYMVVVTLQKCFSKFHPICEEKPQNVYIARHNVVFKIQFMVVLELFLSLLIRYITQNVN